MMRIPFYYLNGLAFYHPCPVVVLVVQVQVLAKVQVTLVTITSNNDL